MVTDLIIQIDLLLSYNKLAVVSLDTMLVMRIALLLAVVIAVSARGKRKSINTFTQILQKLIYLYFVYRLFREVFTSLVRASLPNKRSEDCTKQPVDKIQIN